MNGKNSLSHLELDGLDGAPIIKGYRAWKIVELNGEPALKSPYSAGHRFYWSPGDTVALCDKCRNVVDLMGTRLVTTEIQDDCSCGLYSLKSPEEVIETRHFEANDIIGEILMFGRVIEGQYAYRAEKAIVSALIVPPARYIRPELIERLAERYDAPLIRATGELLRMIMFVRVKTGATILKYGRSPKNVSRGFNQNNRWPGRFPPKEPW